ncbi:hypothetical protein [Lysobacter sp. Root983]|uniref:hypothetical protein n=1 Tax=Lysobacter sp. Root983 TaxID=1736613 RepID=UPI000B2D39D2|nr:hypothetical protein [Lysobacter sp. Root983]
MNADGRRIVAVERIQSAGALLARAPIAWDLQADGDGTRLRPTARIASPAGRR